MGNFGHSRGILVILDVQGYIGNFGSIGVFGSFWVFKGILVILEVKRVFVSFKYF